MTGDQQHEQHNGARLQSNGTKTSTYLVPLQINGEEVKTTVTYKVVNPATNEVAWESYSASKTDAIKAADAAQAAYPAWSRTKVSTRRDIFFKAADIMTRRADELMNYIKAETGGDEAFTTFNVYASAEQLRDVGGRIATVVGQVPAYDKEDRSAMILKEPYGVVLGIAPWYLAGNRYLHRSMLMISGTPLIFLASERLRMPWRPGTPSY